MPPLRPAREERRARRRRADRRRCALARTSASRRGDRVLHRRSAGMPSMNFYRISRLNHRRRRRMIVRYRPLSGLRVHTHPRRSPAAPWSPSAARFSAVSPAAGCASTACSRGGEQCPCAGRRPVSQEKDYRPRNGGVRPPAARRRLTGRKPFSGFQRGAVRMTSGSPERGQDFDARLYQQEATGAIPWR